MVICRPNARAGAAKNSFNPAARDIPERSSSGHGPATVRAGRPDTPRRDRPWAGGLAAFRYGSAGVQRAAHGLGKGHSLQSRPGRSLGRRPCR